MVEPVICCPLRLSPASSHRIIWRTCHRSCCATSSHSSPIDKKLRYTPEFCTEFVMLGMAYELPIQVGVSFHKHGIDGTSTYVWQDGRLAGKVPTPLHCPKPCLFEAISNA